MMLGVHYAIIGVRRSSMFLSNFVKKSRLCNKSIGKRPAYIRGWSRVPSTRSDSISSRHSTRSSSRLSHTKMCIRLDSTESELASTKSELVLMKDERMKWLSCVKR